ncbi:MAG: T9SS type A sorting domain-containing protein, partial [Bacteroidota bacterium]|nr:T9SS type A sorting domain-containing protein [Bacteroidota bacterium]
VQGADGAAIGFYGVENVIPLTTVISMELFGNWIPVQKIIYSVDAEGRMAQMVTQEYQFPNWANSTKEVYLYDEKDTYQGYENYDWDGSWVLSGGQRSDFTYNASDQITEVITLGFDTAWTRYRKESYTLNSEGEISGAISYYNDTTGNWVMTDSAVNITWQEFDPRPGFGGDGGIYTIGGEDYITIERHSWSPFMGWNATRITRTYNTSGNVEMQLVERDMGAGFDNTNKWNYEYYPNGDEKKITSYYWNAGAWVESYIEHSLNTYDADGDLTLSITQDEYDGNVDEEELVAFTYTSFAGIMPVCTMGFNIYPNPAAATLNVSLNETAAAQVNVEVLDLTGRILMSSVVNAEGNVFTVNVETLPAGAYIIAITQDGTRSHHRFVKN